MKLSVGYVNSIQSLGAVDGPGIRFVAFLQGCPLRCSCCHNPETWQFNVGETFSAQQLFDKAVRFKEYFGEKGGVTLSGGEPICQSEFVYDFFSLCKANNINTCLDTSGCILNDSVKKALSVTDRVLLDVKYPSPSLYNKHVGCNLSNVLEFLTYLNAVKLPTTIRQVVVKGINDNDDNLAFLSRLRGEFDCVDGIELLPFRKICSSKYDNLKIKFPFADYPETDEKTIQNLYCKLKKHSK